MFLDCKSYLSRALVNSVICLFYLLCAIAQAVAQEEPDAPDRDFIFLEDKERKEEEIKRKQIGLPAKEKKGVRRGNPDTPFDIDAPNIHFDSEANTVIADGGISVMRGSTSFEADKGQFHVDTKVGKLEGNVWVNDPVGTLAADSAELNLDTVTGTMHGADIYLAEGGYHIQADTVDKLAEDTFKFSSCMLSTCDCPEPDDVLPWRISADEAEITRNGYGKIYGGTLRAYGVPVIYTPYLLFPAKTRRQSGLLPATIGRGRRNGLDLELPFFWAISESSDATITGILESNTRYGVQVEARKVFSLANKVESGLTYLNEEWRDGELLGTDITGLNDPEVNENGQLTIVDRFGGYYSQIWKTGVGELPLQLVVDGKYVSDDLFLREFEVDNIAAYNSRYVTSQAIARSSIGAYSIELSSEYNQALVTDDDVVFQRVPELMVSGIHRFRPFGENPLGAKLILRNNLNAVDFIRPKGFDGQRYEAEETLQLPFHFRNYFDAVAKVGAVGTIYSLTNTDNPNATESDSGLDVEKTSNRVVPNFSFKMSNVVERVYEVSEGNLFKSIVELGTFGRSQELKRLKHTIEPQIVYKYVPFVDQSDNPQFDSGDRLSRYSLVTYSLGQRLFGRSNVRSSYLYGIEETTPELQDLGSLQPAGPLEDEFDIGLFSAESTDRTSLRASDVTEIASFVLSQSFDINEDRKNEDPERSPFSDVNAELLFSPNEYFRLGGESNFNVDNIDFSSYGVIAQMLDKRGDQLRTRLTTTTDRVRQLEAALELVVTDRLKLAYYTRYDDLAGELIESKVGVRLNSACNCWTLDGIASEKVNPDETRFLITLTLIGIGELSNTLFTENRDKPR